MLGFLKIVTVLKDIKKIIKTNQNVMVIFSFKKIIK